MVMLLFNVQNTIAQIFYDTHLLLAILHACIQYFTKYIGIGWSAKLATRPTHMLKCEFAKWKSVWHGCAYTQCSQHSTGQLRCVCIHDEYVRAWVRNIFITVRRLCTGLSLVLIALHYVHQFRISNTHSLPVSEWVRSTTTHHELWVKW